MCANSPPPGTINRPIADREILRLMLTGLEKSVAMNSSNSGRIGKIAARMRLMRGCKGDEMESLESDAIATFWALMSVLVVSCVVATNLCDRGAVNK